MRTSALLRLTAVATAVVASAVGCGSDVTSAPTTTSGSTSPAPSASTTSAPPAPGTIPFITEPPPSASTTGPEGSGCAPPTATELPDGEWFGTVADVDHNTSTMGLDLACLYFYAAADVAAAEAGSSEVPVPNDVWIENESTNVYRLDLVPDVAVGVVPASFSGGESLVAGGDGPDAVSPLVGLPVWVQVRGGWVVAVQQQYFP